MARKSCLSLLVRTEQQCHWRKRYACWDKQRQRINTNERMWFETQLTSPTSWCHRLADHHVHTVCFVFLFFKSSLEWFLCDSAQPDGLVASQIKKNHHTNQWLHRRKHTFKPNRWMASPCIAQFSNFRPITALETMNCDIATRLTLPNRFCATLIALLCFRVYQQDFRIC